MYNLTEKQIKNIIKLTLEEDAFENDITCNSLGISKQNGKATIIAKANGIIACVSIIPSIFHMADPSLKIDLLKKDGEKVGPYDVVAIISGSLKNILGAERTVLNFLSHLSGVATETAKYVSEVEGTHTIIRDTRKTMPGMRLLEKYAVTIGGGQNHRLNLEDGILIKDNHIAYLRKQGLNLTEIIKKARHNSPNGTIIEVEVNTPEEAAEVMDTNIDMIMLDNMSIEDMKKTVGLVSGRVKLEASGGITPDNIKETAMTGVDYIAIGALTHSVKALDFSLEIQI